MFVLKIKGEKKIQFHFLIKSQMPPEMTIDQTLEEIQQYVFIPCRTIF